VLDKSITSRRIGAAGKRLVGGDLGLHPAGRFSQAASIDLFVGSYLPSEPLKETVIVAVG
jgi:hypothetical protein